MFSKYAGAVGQGVADLFKSDPREEYKKLVLDELAKPSSEKPAAVRVLRTLLNNYSVEAGTSTNTRTHSAAANTCVRILDQDNHPEILLKSAIAELNKITAIREGRHFATLLNIYFSAFSEHLSDCNQTIRNVVANGDTWQTLQAEINKGRLVSFMQSYDPNKDDRYEKIAEIASIVPHELAEQYRAFLEKQLQAIIIKEDFGLHKGWAHLALGIIAPHLNEQARADVVSKLRKELETSQNLSSIGAGYALSQLQAEMPGKDYKAVADKLWSYAVQTINDLHETFTADDKTVKTYTDKLFVALHRFSRQYGAQQKNSIKNILTEQPENAHTFSSGLHELSDWFSQSEKANFLEACIRANNIQAAAKRSICRTLPNWVSANKNLESAWSPFSKLKKESYELLSGTQQRRINSTDDIKEHAAVLALLMTDTTPTSSQERINIINALTRPLEKIDHRDNDELYIKIFNALSTLAKWLNSDSHVLDLLFDCSIQGSHSPAYHMHAAHAALQFKNGLYKDDQFTLRDVIIAGLDDPKTATTAYDMLMEYAFSAPVDHLPALATNLMNKYSHEATFLLSQVITLHTGMKSINLIDESKSAVSL